MPLPPRPQIGDGVGVDVHEVLDEERAAAGGDRGAGHRHQQLLAHDVDAGRCRCLLVLRSETVSGLTYMRYWTKSEPPQAVIAALVTVTSSFSRMTSMPDDAAASSSSDRRRCRG